MAEEHLAEVGAGDASQFLTPTDRRVQDRPFIETGHHPRSHSLSVFINKVCRLAYHRLQLLCNILTVARDVVSVDIVLIFCCLCIITFHYG